jgi:hypothetical protein
MTQPLDWVVQLVESSHSEAFAFYNEFRDEYRSDHTHPIIENGFLAAIPRSRFITDWRMAYQACVQSGDYTTFFRQKGNFAELTSNFLRKEHDYIDYFVCYIAAQEVMLRSNDYRLYLVNAEDEYYYLSYMLNPPRSKRKFCGELLLRSAQGHAYSRLVKITGRHRAAIDEHVAYSCYRRDSVIGSQLLADLP